MASQRISQREARKLRKRVVELEGAIQSQRRWWSHEWLGGVSIASATWNDPNATTPVAIRTARRLAHAVVATVDDAGTVNFVALPLPK